MSPHSPWLIAFCLTALACGAGDNQDERGARELLARLQADQYRQWERAPGYEERRQSNAPHSDAVDIYVNDVVAEVLARGSHEGTWPVGSIIAKDGFAGANFEITAVMEKRSDGWFWAEYGEDGAPDYSGRPSICLDCHDAGSDFVRAFRLP